MNEAKTEKKVNTKTGRLAQHFLCAGCRLEFTSKDVQVDHIVEIGRDKTWDEFINGLFCEKDNLQVLCIPCHKIKTLKEKSESKLGNPDGTGTRAVRGRAKPKGK